MDMDQSPENIRKLQNAQHFKGKILKTPTEAYLNIPNIEEDWDVYFMEGSQTLSMRVTTKSGDVTLVGRFFSNSWNNQLSFELQLKDKPESLKELRGKYLLEYLDHEGQPHRKFVSPVCNWVTRNGNPLRDPCIRRSDLLTATNLQGGALVARLTFIHSEPQFVKVLDLQGLEEMVVRTTDNKFPEDMEALLASEMDTDLIIKTSDGVKLNVHRSILKARVPMFKAMLETDMKEKSEGVVETPGISSPAMKILLHFIYTGKLHPDWKEQGTTLIREVLAGAGQYELSGLFQYYDKALVCLCNSTNVNTLLKLAKLHGLKQAEEDISKWKRGDLMDLV